MHPTNVVCCQFRSCTTYSANLFLNLLLTASESAFLLHIVGTYPHLIPVFPSLQQYKIILFLFCDFLPLTWFKTPLDVGYKHPEYINLQISLRILIKRYINFGISY